MPRKTKRQLRSQEAGRRGSLVRQMKREAERLGIPWKKPAVIGSPLNLSSSQASSKTTKEDDNRDKVLNKDAIAEAVTLAKSLAKIEKERRSNVLQTSSSNRPRTCFACLSNLEKKKTRMDNQIKMEVDDADTMPGTSTVPAPLAEPIDNGNFNQFMQILDIPAYILKVYCKRVGAIQTWISLCSECLAEVDTMRQIHEKIELLDEELIKQQQKIIQIVQDSHENNQKGKKRESQEQSESEQYIESLRKYVYSRSFLMFRKKRKLEETLQKNSKRAYKAANQAIKLSKRIARKERLSKSREFKSEMKPIVTKKKVKPIQTHSFPTISAVLEDPLSSQNGNEDDEVLMDFEELNSTVSSNYIITSSTPFSGGKDAKTSSVYFCGMCDDFTEFSSEALLTAHQFEVHARRAASPSIQCIPKLEEEVDNDGSRDREYPLLDCQTNSNNDQSEIASMSALKKVSQDVSSNPSMELEESVKNAEEIPHIVHYAYSCPNCPHVKKYSLNKYAQHLAIHLRMPYRCKECFEFLPNDESVREQHWNDKHRKGNDNVSSVEDKFVEIKFDPGKIWICEGCNCYLGFFTEEERNAHETSCEKCHSTNETRTDIDFCCSECQINFRNRDEWRLHRVINHLEKDSISCLYCDESFPASVLDFEGKPLRDPIKFLEHCREKHASYTARIYDECESCGLVFVKSGSYEDHCLKNHGIPLKEVYSCNICNKGLSTKETLRSHMGRVHFHTQKSEVFVCDACGVGLKTQATLFHHKYSKHGIISEGTQVIACSFPDCLYKSVVRSRVTRHKNTVHPNNDDMLRFTCQYCGKVLKNQSHFKAHLTIHENKDSKPFQCDICGNSFAVKNYLYIHKRLSHEKRVFPSTNKKKPRKTSKKMVEKAAETVTESLEENCAENTQH